MKPFQSFSRVFLAIILLSSMGWLAGPAQIGFNVSITGLSTNPETVNEAINTKSLPSLRDFSTNVKNGWTGVPTGVFVPGVMALPVLQQPANNAGYVSSQPDTLTQFRMANKYNSTGILAHDYLAGVRFSQLKIGQEVAVINGDGIMRFYRIYDIQRYQALSPTSPYSVFVDLSNNTRISAETLFYRTYGLGKNTLVFQTCISTDKVNSWGRLFVLAKPADNPTLSLAQFIPSIERAFSSASKTILGGQVLTASR
jgi:hypothetical protein